MPDDMNEIRRLADVNKQFKAKLQVAEAARDEATRAHVTDTDTITRMTERLEKMERHHDDDVIREMTLQDRVTALTVQAQRLREALRKLRKHGWHHDGCLAGAYNTKTRKPIGIACTCGLSEALDAT